MDTTASGLFVALLTSLVGFAYFSYGRKTRQARFVACGVGLMACSYFVDSLLGELALAAAFGGAPFLVALL